MRALAASLLLTGLGSALAGCGLQPIYAEGRQGVAAEQLSMVAVSPIAERSGQMLQEELLRQLQPDGSPAYRLDVALQERIEGFGIRGDESVARERVSLTATYRLVDVATDKVLLEDVASSDAGIDVVRSEYAVVAAERTAFERNTRAIANRIITRLALYFRTQNQ
ncbi:LPS assembly lipoprotein LptE [Pedomonas mirosovicensis]|uniref:LPS assembly lipoprotein LptE n=1 Tax=Pedomonas mirosovicensis TaxID=2908641 RepID=UPI00216933D8|nr:LPS assembly lipoprotein LptE [Pedomonas mirosovicensis]MCH8684117.1 LPS assembly lipoprotein LptE [Pedomonas mirosovicensis]